MLARCENPFAAAGYNAIFDGSLGADRMLNDLGDGTIEMKAQSSD